MLKTDTGDQATILLTLTHMASDTGLSSAGGPLVIWIIGEALAPGTTGVILLKTGIGRSSLYSETRGSSHCVVVNWSPSAVNSSSLMFLPCCISNGKWRHDWNLFKIRNLETQKYRCPSLTILKYCWNKMPRTKDTKLKTIMRPWSIFTDVLAFCTSALVVLPFSWPATNLREETIATPST